MGFKFQNGEKPYVKRAICGVHDLTITFPKQPSSPTVECNNLISCQTLLMLTRLNESGSLL